MTVPPAASHEAHPSSPRRGFSIPVLASVRGAGLGNEAFAWAKALIGAYELGLVPLHPAWALNRRGYRRDFGTSRLDWLVERGLRSALPEVRVTSEQVIAAGSGNYTDLMRSLRPELARRRSPVALVHASGMAGGYQAILPARLALQSRLLAPSHVARDLFLVGRALRPDRVRVAVHVRAGEGFEDGSPGPGDFNRRIPAAWYAAAVGAVADAVGPDRVEVVLVGDVIPSELASLISRRCTLVELPSRRRPLLSDLQLLALADLLVCSVSSFSMLAAFLSDAPYVWYGPHLSSSAGGRVIWPPDAAAPRAVGTSGSDRPRGVPLDEGEQLPDHLIAMLEARIAVRDRRSDLLYFGAVR